MNPTHLEGGLIHICKYERVDGTRTPTEATIGKLLKDMKINVLDESAKALFEEAEKQRKAA